MLEERPPTSLRQEVYPNGAPARSQDWLAIANYDLLHQKYLSSPRSLPRKRGRWGASEYTWSVYRTMMWPTVLQLRPRTAATFRKPEMIRPRDRRPLADGPAGQTDFPPGRASERESMARALRYARRLRVSAEGIKAKDLAHQVIRKPERAQKQLKKRRANWTKQLDTSTPREKLSQQRIFKMTINHLFLLLAALVAVCTAANVPSTGKESTAEYFEWDGI